MPLDESEVLAIKTAQVRESDVRVDLSHDTSGRARSIDSLPPLQRIEQIQMAARIEMTEVLTKRAKAMIEREISIGMGEVEQDGKPPDFMVQAITLKSLRQQLMGSPTQRIEQKSQSMILKATYDLPSDKIDRDSQPDKTKIPESLTAQLQPKQITAILATKPDHGISAWKHISGSEVSNPLPDVGSGPVPRQEPTPMDKK